MWWGDGKVDSRLHWLSGWEPQGKCEIQSVPRRTRVWRSKWVLLEQWGDVKECWRSHTSRLNASALLMASVIPFPLRTYITNDQVSMHNRWILFLKYFIYLIFRERGREGERERNINRWMPLARPLLGTWPATQACALTGNRTSNPLVLRLALNPLSYTSQGL